MARKGLTALTFLLLVLAILMPIGLSSYWAKVRAERTFLAQVDVFSTRTLQRVERVLHQAVAALQQLDGDTFEPCSSKHLLAMRRASFSFSYVQEVIYVDGKSPRCSSLVNNLQVAELPAPDWQGAPGYSAWFQANNDLGLNKPMVNLRFGRHVVVIDPGSYVDIVPLNDQIGLGVLDTQNGRVIAALGSTDRNLLAEAAARGQDSFRDKDNYFVIRRSSVLPVMVVAYTPLTGFFEDFLSQLELWLPLGLLISILVAWLLLKLLRQRLSTRNQLLEALLLQQFQVHYQPIIELASGRCVGAEALLRWRLPDGSYVRPDIFIPQAQSDGLIQQITDRLITLIFSDVGNFLASRPDLHVSINVAPEDLQTRRVLDTLPVLLKKHGVAASQICIEATERGFIDADSARLIIDGFREAGHPVYIDDFGTGYSSLAYLQKLNVDVLKIDKLFVDTLVTEGVTNKVALHIIKMAHSLNLMMIAEGIEHAAQVDYLHKNGVQYGQGWLFAKAMPIKRFIEFCTEAKEID